VVRELAFAVPGDLAAPTGGYAYDRRVIDELRKLGWTIRVVNLGDGFPRPSEAQTAFAAEQLAAIPAGRPVVIDGLAYGVLPDAAEELRRRNPIVALVHHPLALETGLSAVQMAHLREFERAALACARRVIVTSAATARVLSSDYDVAEDRIAVVLPGTHAARATRGNSDGVPRLLSVGAVVPRKGFDTLIAALAAILDLPWHLTIAGDRTRDPACAAQLDANIARFRLAERIAVLGTVSDERISELYRSADAFVLASRFEGYGMAFAEAIAHGLPIVGTTAGAIPDTVPQGAGVLVPPDDAQALAGALRGLMENPAERQRMSDFARGASASQPSWAESGKLFAQAVETLL
jgi:glycosyltransferase involved in cell wall biosynthesis